VQAWEFIVAGLAVYKALHLLNGILAAFERELQSVVQVAIGVVLGYVAALIVGADHLALAGLAVASLASGWYTFIRLLWLVGDSSVLSRIQTKTLRGRTQ
jgi:xanthine/uracil permease